jgi:hypothetical protein
VIQAVPVFDLGYDGSGKWPVKKWRFSLLVSDLFCFQIVHLFGFYSE